MWPIVPAGQLRLLDRKRLELARALATQPKLILLDEIAGGLTEKELPPLIEMIKGLKDEGVTVVWIEHIVHALLAVVDQLMCLAFGRILAIGDPREVMASPGGRRGVPRLHLRHGGIGVSLLQVSALDVHYGDFQAVYGVDLSLSEGETLAVIGANGAGKSTLLKALAGQVTALKRHHRLRRRRHHHAWSRTSGCPSGSR